MRYIDLDCRVAAIDDVGLRELSVLVVNQGDFAGDLDAEVLSDDALDSAVFPQGTAAQCVALRVYVDGVLVPRSVMAGETTVTRDYNNLTQGWSFSVYLTTPLGTLGGPFACYGPGIGKKPVDICGVYKTDSGVIEIPLIKDGVVDNSSRQSGESGIIETFNGVDRCGRFDGVKMTKQFHPGHGLPRGRVAKIVMNELGETQTNFEDGRSMYKEVQFVDTEPIPTLDEIFETESRRFVYSPDGYASNPKVGRVGDDETIQMTILEKDVIRAETVSLDPQANVITLVVANGTQQNVKDACDVRVETQWKYEYADYTPQRSLYRQSMNGGTYVTEYTTLAEPPEATEPTLVRKTKTTRMYRCDQLWQEIVTTWELKRREGPRFIWNNPGGTYDWRAITCYTDDQNGVEGGPAYVDMEEILLPVSSVRTIYFFLQEEFYTGGGLVTGTNPWYAFELHKNTPYEIPGESEIFANSGRFGHALGSITFVHAMNKVYGGYKYRSSLTYPQAPWTDIEPTAGAMIWGDGGGVGELDENQLFMPPSEVSSNVPVSQEALMQYSATISVLTGNSKNQLINETKYVYGHRARRGSNYFYGENDYRSELSEKFRLTDIQTIDYSSNGDSYTVTTSERDEITGKTKTTLETGKPGDLPAIPMLDFIVPDDSIYEGDEGDELQKVTRRRDTTQIIVTIPYDFLLTCHLPREVVTEFPWAEDEQELRNMIDSLVQDSASQLGRFTLAANFLIQEAMPIQWTYAPLAINHRVRVQSVNWSQPVGGPILTRVECKLYPW